MKWTIEIDCSPEEARRFMGMPDVTELHKEMMNKMQENFANLDAESLMKIWMPFMNTQSVDQGFDFWQKMMGEMMKASTSMNFGTSPDNKTKK